jgi:formylglycine-generating enzyme required for sulfatase activity
MRHTMSHPVCRLLIATLLLFCSFAFAASTADAAEAAPKKKAKKAATEDRGLAVVEKNRATGKRIALVIGNGSYRHTDSMPKLANPPNDADDMATALRRFGFEVIAKKNLTKEEMDETITDFGRKIADSDAALFYYAGHGLQVKGQNYMVPVDANIDSEAKVPYRAVNVNQLLEEMDSSRSRVNIVMLDACRNNPISGKFRSGSSRGLAPPSTMPKGTVVVYATDPGNVAADGGGRNGVFTSGLLTAFRGNDLTLGGVLYAASKQVQDATGRQQTPYINGPATVQREFSFVSPSSMTDLQPSPVQPAPVAPPAKKFQLNPLAVEEPPPETARPSSPRAFSDHTTGMDFVPIKGGCFDMGDSFGDGNAEEKPVHEVCLDGFSMAKYDVTVGQFRKFVNATGYRTDAEKNTGGVNGCYAMEFGKDKLFDWRDWGSWKNPNKYLENEENHPVACVSWNDAQEFVKWLNGKSGASYRLPTEAEWEYAARAGSSGRNYWGNSKDTACGFANVADQTKMEGGVTFADTHKCSDGYPYVAPVGQFKPNGFGLYDMMGNVWQWTGDWYGEKYYGSSPKNNPTGPSTGSDRVYRGGGWSNVARGVRAAVRDGFSPGSCGFNLGFRLASPVQ